MVLLLRNCIFTSSRHQEKDICGGWRCSQKPTEIYLRWLAVFTETNRKIFTVAGGVHRNQHKYICGGWWCSQKPTERYLRWMAVFTETNTNIFAVAGGVHRNQHKTIFGGILHIKSGPLTHIFLMLTLD